MERFDRLDAATNDSAVDAATETIDVGSAAAAALDALSRKDTTP